MSPNFSSIQAIFFDTCDTLYTSDEMEREYPRECEELIMGKYGVAREEARTMLADAVRALAPEGQHVSKIQAMVARFGFTRPQVCEAYCRVDPKKFLSADPELCAVIEGLASRYKLGLISNNPRPNVIAILETLELDPAWFPILITADLVEASKPDPEPFMKAIELAICPPDACLYLGDNPKKDMRPAKELGMMTVLVRSNPKEEDMAHADANIADVKKIVEFLSL